MKEINLKVKIIMNKAGIYWIWIICGAGNIFQCNFLVQSFLLLVFTIILSLLLNSLTAHRHTVSFALHCITRLILSPLIKLMKSIDTAGTPTSTPFYPAIAISLMLLMQSMYCLQTVLRMKNWNITSIYICTVHRR